MRILLVNYEWPGVTANCGGGGTVSEALRDGLERRGHDVRVVTDDADGHYATFPARSYRDLRDAVAWADVVNGHFSLPTSLALPRLCARDDTPLAVSVMGADVYDPTRYGWVRPLTRPLNDYVLSNADVVIAPSTDMVDRVTDRFGIDPQRIPYGIDPNEWLWYEREQPDRIKVLTVCRLVERKNLELARDAVKALASGPESRVDWRVVGTGPLADTVESWDVADARGYVDDLQAEFDWGDVFFLPSKHEAFGIVFLEALACGLPVVTSSSGGQRDIVTDAVGIAGTGTSGNASPSQTDSYTAMLRAVVDDYERYQRATEGYVATRFTRETMVSRYEGLFQRLT